MLINWKIVVMKKILMKKITINMTILICLQSKDRLIIGCNQKLINLSLDKSPQWVKEPESKRIVNMLRKDQYLLLITRWL